MLSACKDNPPPPPNKPCSWVNDERVVYQDLKLIYAGADLLNYRFIYGDGPITSFSSIFCCHNEQKKSEIKVTTKANGCTGTTSKTDLFTFDNYARSVGINDIRNLSGPTNSNGFPQVTVEIKSGIHRATNGTQGYVVWSKTASAEPYALQNGTFNGVFKATSTASSVSGDYGGGIVYERVYMNGEFRTMELTMESMY